METPNTGAKPVEVRGDRGGLRPFEVNGKIGYEDETGIVIPAQYDDAKDFAFGLAPVNLGASSEYPGGFKDGGKWGYINSHGEVIVPFTLKYADEFSDGLAKVWDEEEGVRYIDPEGKTVIVLGKATAGDFREGLAPVCIDRSLEGKGWQTRFINKRGETAFVVDGYAEELYEGLAVLRVRSPSDPDSRLCGFIDRNGHTVISPRFAHARHFSEGLAAVRSHKDTVGDRGETWGYIDRTGQYVIPPQFNEAHPFVNGVSIVHVGGKLHSYGDARPYWEGGEWLIIDKQGKVLKRSKQWIDYQDFGGRGQSLNSE